MQKISEILYERSTPRFAGLATLLFFLFLFFVLPGQSERAGEYAAETGSPDQSFIYTAGELMEMAEGYGPDGRAAYIRTRWSFDLVFPLVYGLFLLSTIGWALSKSTVPGSPWRLLNLVPVVGVLFDYLENIAASAVMARFPAETPLAAGLAPVFTLIKWIFVGGSFPVLFGALIALFFNRRK